MERIPEKYRAENLPVPATFTSDQFPVLELRLEEMEEKENAKTGVVSRIIGTGCAVKFKGGALAVKNTKLLKMVMESPAYLNNQIRINPDDPTGFWRAQGAIVTKTVQVVRFEDFKKPTFDDIELKFPKPKDVETIAVVA